MGYTDERSPNKSSDDSFEADCYKHIEKKLETELPNCLSKDSKINLTNHFLNKKTSKDSSKKVIRRRLSSYQLKAAVLNEKSNNNTNCNNNVPKAQAHQGKYNNNNESDDRSSADSERQSTYVLQAKVQHLLFEMKKLRQSDRDLLRQFYAVNDTIEELKWMYEEKEASLAKDLMEEEDEIKSNSSNDDPYEKDMLALEDADLYVEEEEEENSSGEGLFSNDGDLERRSSHASKSGNTDTLDSGLTKSLSSFSLTNSSPTMSYQMSGTSSRSHSPSESTVSSSLTHNSAYAKSPTEFEWEKQTQTNIVPKTVSALSSSYSTGSYNNNTYDEVHCVANSYHAGGDLNSIDYVSRKKEYHRSYSDVSQKIDSNLRHKKLYSSMSFNHHTKTTIPSKITAPSQMTKHEPLRSCDVSSSKVSASYRLLRHPLAQQHQIRRATSFQENTPSLQPWRYRFVPIDENDTEAKLNTLSYDDRNERIDDDRYYQRGQELIRQKSQTLDRNQQQHAPTYSSHYTGRHLKTTQSHRISGIGSAGSLTSQSSSSDSSTSSLQSVKRREAERRHNVSDAYKNMSLRSYNGDIAHSRDVSYKRPLTTATSTVYNWVQSQHDDVMYL